MHATDLNDDGRPPWRHRLARAGQFGFLFFFVKGLAWLVIPLGMWIGS